MFHPCFLHLHSVALIGVDSECDGDQVVAERSKGQLL